MYEHKGFLLFHDDLDMISGILDNDSAMELLHMLKDYSKDRTEKISKNKHVNVLYNMLKNKIKEAQNNHETLVNKRKEAGRKGGLAKLSNAKQSQAELSKAKKDKIKENKIKEDKINENNINTTMSDKVGQESGEVEEISANEVAKSIYTDDFERFWSAYPKKVGKGGAYKSFKKVENIKHTLPLMLQAIEEQKNTEQWKKEKGQFIPHPQTWLNQRRWEDSVGTENIKTHNGVDLDEVLRQGGNIYEYLDWRNAGKP